MTEESGIWELRLGLFATRQQAEEVQERIIRMLCPDPDHAPPCPIPWSVTLLDGESLDEPGVYSELAEQARIEQGRH
jgi:hypothetical protein